MQQIRMNCNFHEWMILVTESSPLSIEVKNDVAINRGNMKIAFKETDLIMIQQACQYAFFNIAQNQHYVSYRWQSWCLFASCVFLSKLNLKSNRGISYADRYNKYLGRKYGCWSKSCDSSCSVNLIYSWSTSWCS